MAGAWCVKAAWLRRNKLRRVLLEKKNGGKEDAEIERTE